MQVSSAATGSGGQEDLTLTDVMLGPEGAAEVRANPNYVPVSAADRPFEVAIANQLRLGQHRSALIQAFANQLTRNDETIAEAAAGSDPQTAASASAASSATALLDQSPPSGQPVRTNAMLAGASPGRGIYKGFSVFAPPAGAAELAAASGMGMPNILRAPGSSAIGSSAASSSAQPTAGTKVSGNLFLRWTDSGLSSKDDLERD